jgi:hypothetical protein
MFAIKTSRDFYGKLLEDFADFQSDQTSARCAINCAVTAYHLHEWVWGDWLKTDFQAWKALGIRDRNSFIAWMDRNMPWFTILQSITNGSKHFDRNESAKTQVVGAFDPRVFQNNAFDVRRRKVDSR